MTRFFERFLEKKKVENVDENKDEEENVENVACAREERNRESRKYSKKVRNAILCSCAQSTTSTKLGVVKNESIDTQHRFPACLNCLSYSWKAEGNLMRPWCKKINTGVFELVECPKGQWKKSKVIIR